MVTQINQTVQVGAVFEPPDKVRPAWFVWQGRRHVVREVTYTWVHREGRCMVQNFAVSDGANLYQISYHTDAMTWLLVAVEDGC